MNWKLGDIIIEDSTFAYFLVINILPSSEISKEFTNCCYKEIGYLLADWYDDGSGPSWHGYEPDDTVIRTKLLSILYGDSND